MFSFSQGHIEMSLCDSGDLSDPEGVVTQTCFNKYPLDRAEDDEFNAPIDPENRGRFFLDPPCRAAETDQTMPDRAAPGDVATARFKLPDGVTCDRCIVQMVYCELIYFCLVYEPWPRNFLLVLLYLYQILRRRSRGSLRRM